VYLYTHFFVLRGDIFLFLSIPCVCVCFQCLVYHGGTIGRFCLSYWVFLGGQFFCHFLNELNGLRGGLDCTYLDMNTPSLPPSLPCNCSCSRVQVGEDYCDLL